MSFLKGGSSAAIGDLQKRMEQAAENLEFEKAAKLRDRINAIKRSLDKQKVFSVSVEEQDVFAVVSDNEKSCLNVLRFSDGRLTESEHFIFDTSENLPESRSELIRSFYSFGRKVPPRISVDGEISDEELMTEWLSSIASRRVVIATPQRGVQVQLIEMCKKNAAEKLIQSLGRSNKKITALQELAASLGLSSIPEYIEAYDISHTGGSDNVAGMIVFKDGAPLKSAYKRFAIKGFDGQNDYASMAEVIERRFNHYFEEEDSGTGFGKLPDLILLDGGKGQVQAVLPVLRKFGINIPLFGMVKDNKHRTRAIATGGEEISLTSKRTAFNLVSEIQDEVHRFAISYHRSKHRKKGYGSTLTEIEGIGEKRAKALLRHFKTVTAVKNASIDELLQVKGISKSAAEAVFYHFNNEKQ